MRFLKLLDQTCSHEYAIVLSNKQIDAQAKINMINLKENAYERERERETCTVFRGTSPEETAATTLITKAPTLTVSWNWINF